MHIIEATNIRDALPKAVNYIINNGEIEDSRLGPVLVSPIPVTIYYHNPKQHVLLNPIRNANPFFHLMESIWMLAGRDDAAYLDNYIKDFGKLYAKDGMVMDAYGQRWRYGYKYDQLDEIVNQLRKDPTTRQAVLQIWGAGRDDLRAYSAKPCNLIVAFRIYKDSLNMTVYNRSNDLILGCCGANAVHFPILQEYLALRIGVSLGEYWQVSNNLHFYIDQKNMFMERIGMQPSLDYYFEDHQDYEDTVPLMEYPLVFDEELKETIFFIDQIHKNNDPTIDIYTGNISNTFLRDVVIPMALAHRAYKLGHMSTALKYMDDVIAEDWKRAGTEWLERHHGKN